ncbi:hypothetical protein ACF0H5_013926 [Mactra antiquata]
MNTFNGTNMFTEHMETDTIEHIPFSVYSTMNKRLIFDDDVVMGSPDENNDNHTWPRYVNDFNQSATYTPCFRKPMDVSECTLGSQQEPMDITESYDNDIDMGDATHCLRDDVRPESPMIVDISPQSVLPVSDSKMSVDTEMTPMDIEYSSPSVSYVQSTRDTMQMSIDYTRARGSVCNAAGTQCTGAANVQNAAHCFRFPSQNTSGHPMDIVCCNVRQCNIPFSKLPISSQLYTTCIASKQDGCRIGDTNLFRSCTQSTNINDVQISSLRDNISSPKKSKKRKLEDPDDDVYQPDKKRAIVKEYKKKIYKHSSPIKILAYLRNKG